MMMHFRKRLTDVLAELNEIVATEGAKERTMTTTMIQAAV